VSKKKKKSKNPTAEDSISPSEVESNPHSVDETVFKDSPLPMDRDSVGDIIPERIGRYDVVKVLGRGGYGVVYLGYDDTLRRKVAIKVPRVEEFTEKIEREFLTEARQLAQLSHQGIVTVFDIVAEDDFCFIVFDFVEGETLSERLRSRPPTFVQAAEIAVDIADALAHAHSQRTVHRDLKQANVIMSGAGKPVIVDFGLSLSDTQRAIGTRLGEISGTPAYMSPEQAAGEGHRIDGRTDIYSLGVILYRMLTGRLPFESRRMSELLRQVREDEPQPPRQIVRSLPPELQRICMKAMEKSLTSRYLTADDFADDLRNFLGSGQKAEGYVAPPVRTKPPEEPPTPPATRAPKKTTDRSGSEEPNEPLAFLGNEESAGGVTQSEGNSRRSKSGGSRSERSRSRRSRSGDSSSLSGSSSQSRVRGAQRRQITVVNCGCDIFENEDALELLDAEEQAEVVEVFQQLCRQECHTLEGAVLSETDDGLSVCFGFPISFEDAAQRAMRFGLSVLKQTPVVSKMITEKHGISLSARVVAHTEVAVVESKEVSEEAGISTSVSIGGKVRTVTNRLEHIAEIGALIVTEQAYEIIQNHFDCESLGKHRLKGVAGEIELFRIDSERKGDGNSDSGESQSLTPLIGRERELELLVERWEQAVEGMGQVVLVIGEAGLGKSRLLYDLKQRISEGEEQPQIMEWRSAPQYQNSSLYSAVECFRRILNLERGDSGETRLKKMEDHLSELGLDGPQEIALLAGRLSIPLHGKYPELEVPPQRRKELLLEFLMEWLQELSVLRPLLFVIEDLHWVDPSTLEFLEKLVDEGMRDRILTIMTFRPEFETPWGSKAHQTNLALNRLTKRQVRELAEAKAGHPIQDELLKQLIDRTDGVPLFVEEFAKMYLDTDPSSSTDLSHAIPSTLQDMLMARLDRMASNIDVVQMAATAGREFTLELMHTASNLEEDELYDELEKLVEAELLFSRGRGVRKRYSFKHALIQDAAYSSMIKSRRHDFHSRIGAAIEAKYPELCSDQPELLALHFTEGNQPEAAIPYWEAAGIASVDRRAFKEAIQQLNQGLALITANSDGDHATPERIQTEVRMLTAIGVPLQATLGYSAPEVEETYTRALKLCAKMESPHERFPILYGMFRYYMLQAKYEEANSLADKLVAIANDVSVPHFVVASNRAKGGPPLYQGRWNGMLHHFETVINIEATPELRARVYRYDVVDPWIASRSYLSWGKWLQGDVHTSLEHSVKAVDIARCLDHSFSMALAICFSQWIHQFRRDVKATRQTAETALELAQENNFAFWFGWCRVMRGWAMSQQGEANEGVSEIELGIKEWRSTGSELGCHYYFTLLAEARLAAKKFDMASAALDNAQQFVDDTGEGFWSAEIARNRAEIIIAENPNNGQEAEKWLEEAIKRAHSQSAGSLVLRATLSLANLWSEDDRKIAAAEMLQSALNDIQGGEETADVKAAQLWLQQQDNG